MTARPTTRMLQSEANTIDVTYCLDGAVRDPAQTKPIATAIGVKSISGVRGYGSTIPLPVRVAYRTQ